MADKFIGQKLAEKYRIDEELRESGLGKIYRGTHLSMNKPVLIKVLSPELAEDAERVERFSAEARIVSQISHPNILNVMDSGTTENKTTYIVFEEAEGEILEKTIEREGLFTVEHAVRIARQIASALSAAHSKDILHHHLNSANVMLARTPDNAELVKVLGFGSVKFEDALVRDDENPPEHFEYLAPEQLSDSANFDERSDIYSLGVILYEMLSGKVPFAGDNPTEIVEKQELEPPSPLVAFRDDLPDEFETMVLRAMAKNPEARYQTANEFAEDLSRVAKDFDENDSLVVPRAAAAAANEKNNLWKTAFVVLTGITLLAIGMIYATSVKQTDPVTLLQADEKGIPVQPINPATGVNERDLTIIDAGSVPAEYMGSSVESLPGITIAPGNDGNPYWQNGTLPPGAPTYKGGEMITVEGGSQFMPNYEGGQIILIPIQPDANTNTNAKPAPTKTPKGGQPANTAPSPAPEETPKTPTKTPVPKTPVEKTPAKPAETPKPKASTPESGKNVKSGEEQNT